MIMKWRATKINVLWDGEQAYILEIEGCFFEYIVNDSELELLSSVVDYKKHIDKFTVYDYYDYI